MVVITSIHVCLHMHPKMTLILLHFKKAACVFGGAMHSPLLASEAFCSSSELLEPGHHLLSHLVELRVAGHLHLKLLLLPVATEHSKRGPQNSQLK